MLLTKTHFSCLISYPFRYIKIRRLIKSGKCFNRTSAGKILGCYVYNDKADPVEHDWNGCKCKLCNKTRDEQHDWNVCKCRICGKTRDDLHVWEYYRCYCTTTGSGPYLDPNYGAPDSERDDVYYEYRCSRCGETKTESSRTE